MNLRMRSSWCFLVVGLSLCFGAAAAPQSFNVRNHGAIGDGRTMDTKALQQAIDACAATGGTVVVPPGNYLTGTFELRSRVTLRLERGATLLGSTSLSDYVPHAPDLRSYNDLFLKYSLIYAEGLEDVAITGEGVIDGQGGAFPVAGRERPTRYKDRPYVLRFVNCRKVTVEGIELRNSAMWMQHYFGCEDVLIRGIRVWNHANKNNDMLDIDGCRRVLVTDCVGDTDDDAITIKSTSARITEDVIVSNCIVSSHCNAVKLGTESIGGFRNISISNFVITPSRADSVRTGFRNGISGITLSLVDGGIMESIRISGVVMDGPVVPIFIRLGDRGRLPALDAPRPGVGSMRDISISSVIARRTGSIGCSITGLPDASITGVTLSDIRIEFEGGGTASTKPVPELPEDYPESTMWGPLPAYGFFVRHVEGLILNDITVTTRAADSRPAFWFESSKRIRCQGIDAVVGPAADAVVTLSGVEHMTMSRSIVSSTAAALLRLVGGSNKGISIMGNDLSRVRTVAIPSKSAAAVTVIGNVMP